MRLILILVALAALAFGGWWVWGSRQVDARLAQVTADLEDRGWQLDYETEGTTGFPYRFLLDLDEIAAVSPDGGFGWQSPRLRFVSQSYQPNRLIALAADEHVVRLPGQELAITAQAPRASGAVELDTRLPVSEATAEAGAVRIRSDLGWEATLGRVLTALRAVPEGEGYDVFAEATALALPEALLAAWDPQGRLPREIPITRLEAGLATDAPLALAGAPARVEALDLRELSLDWGPVKLDGEGRLEIAADGTPEGELVLRITGWQVLLDLAAEAGLPVAQSPLLRGALEQMQSDGVLEAPISFSDGRMALGFVPLGPAPRLR
ncbi:DUF2125 domain-containing protein [Limimaricola pyoseonensis]|uniref:DUF2125 domain-containing protein n=1 Tax=Limimaricola pyoseonensis TaxID=521013 RepID=A0A1G7CEN5_9RHOB|nr:DUF2125 domain-containing protein [Limimaricola pyoseonensis]SDE37844.1 hypothetical protein SAMN04488567_1471 [Limimaricola pyoseonensis]